MAEPEPFLALVKWTDAHHVLDFEDLWDDFAVQTVGWVIGTNLKFMAVAAESMPEDASSEWRGVTFIPHGMVTEVVRLAEWDPIDPDAFGDKDS